MKKTPWRIVPERHEVFVGNKEVDLSSKELDILIALSESGKTMSREELLDKVWGHDWTGIASRTVDQHVSRIRRKMAPLVPVITVPCRGYKIAK